MSGYVVCPSCGVRIKAGREHCLRCFAPLPDPDTPVRPPIWESLGLSQDALMIVIIVASVLVLSLVAVIWRTWPDPVDDTARPASAQAVAPSTTVPTVSGAPPVTTAVTGAPVSPPIYQPPPVAAIDSSRSGTAAFNAGDFASARVAYERALVLKPDDSETLNNLGQVLVRLGQVNEAIPRFERAIALAPDKSAFHFNLAHAAAQLGQLDRSIAEYREAVKLFPDDYATQFNLAMALQAKGDSQAAIPEFQRAIRLAPGEPSFHISLALSLEKAGRLADAASEYRQFLQMEPSSPDAAKLKAHIDVLTGAPPIKP